MVDCVGMHLMDRECVHTMVGAVTSVYKVWIVSVINAFRLSLVS